MKDTDLNSTTSIITLNVSGLNITIKDRSLDWGERGGRSNYMLATRNILYLEG